MRNVHHWALAAFALAAAACGGQALPAKQLADSEAAIRAADEMHANQVPRAALHLTLAKEQYAAAQQAINAGDYQRARIALGRADADAELALALAQSDQAAKDAQQATEKVQNLEREIPSRGEEGRP